MWANRARSHDEWDTDREQPQAAWEREQRIENILREVVVRIGPDLELARTATQFKWEDLLRSFTAAKYFAGMDSVDVCFLKGF